MKKKVPNKIRNSVRYVALEIIERVENNQAYSNLLVKEGIKRADLNDADSRLLSELVYGTISRKLTLDYYLNRFVTNKKLDAWVRELLWLAIYQFVYLDKIPDHAIIHESVEIAKAVGNPGIGKFVNGVLRNIQRKGIPETIEIPDPLERLSIETSMPKWLVEKLAGQYGLERTTRLAQALLEPSKVSARICDADLSQEEAINILAQEGIKVVASDVSPYGIIGKKGYLAGSKLFLEGRLTIQDESSMLVAPSMQLASDSIVLDACAAPGGKTTHIAQLLDSSQGGKVIALDIHNHKLKLVQENAKRLGVSDVIDTVELDARLVFDQFGANYFDRILVDAPCSGLGLMRRKPDIKYTKKPSDFDNLASIQLDILNSVANTLKPGGILTYSTCTIISQENQMVIDNFLKTHQEFEKVEVAGWQSVAKAYQDEMLQLLPDEYDTDGFFICCLKKKHMQK